MVDGKISTTYGTKSLVTVIPGQTDLNELVKTFADEVFPETKRFIVSVKSEGFDTIRLLDLTEENNFTFPDAPYFNIIVSESMI
jgi:hypothetical protein